MDNLFWTMADSRSVPVRIRDFRRRTPIDLRPGCEILEGRQLLSRVALGTAAGLLSPPAAVVANATSILTTQAGPAFQQLSSDLQRVEQSSKVTPSQFARLQADARKIDHAIESTNLGSPQISKQLAQLQDVIDLSFIGASYKLSTWNKLQQQMASALHGMAVSNGLTTIQRLAVMPLPVVSTPTISSSLVHNTFTLMRKIAREAHVSLADHQAIVADEKAVAAALGPNPNSNLGGGTPRNPLVVYYDSQSANFVH